MPGPLHQHLNRSGDDEDDERVEGFDEIEHLNGKHVEDEDGPHETEGVEEGTQGKTGDNEHTVFKEFDGNA